MTRSLSWSCTEQPGLKIQPTSELHCDGHFSAAYTFFLQGNQVRGMIVKLQIPIYIHLSHITFFVCYCQSSK
uniref:Uncharacterized protein n=1 Tax=Anguilla anguilla TaxID=7936 RepID=A0A0E9WIF7_ANGAN